MPNIQSVIARKKSFPLGLLAAGEREETLSRRTGVPVRTIFRFDYTIQSLPICLCLWKVVVAEALTKKSTCTKSDVYITAAHGHKGKSAVEYLQS